MPADSILYSERYEDSIYEYRHVILPPDIAQCVPKGRLLSEPEWRALGVQQSRGWVHYSIHRPEPHILLFRRPRGYGEPAMQQRLAQMHGLMA
ncbi:cyclin-dependent kinases regulatory subunit 1 [Chlorella sorokiniana]|uniref:Cyclin-dependent kinases regulatory subunit n=1 Tax=Chlorella sorokiniana TaxID=3076 RepID=A0A2P6TUP2_CHLSO|nr:cyclin-dependent kinases regulatory subunit 1 [Chlorella sorokiniana]|eukprot:PRW57792.1 cyclin-dependent kinases regulatory subunit 1 [Chlorella sorokiniana]